MKNQEQAITITQNIQQMYTQNQENKGIKLYNQIQIIQNHYNQQKNTQIYVINKQQQEPPTIKKPQSQFQQNTNCYSNSKTLAKLKRKIIFTYYSEKCKQRQSGSKRFTQIQQKSFRKIISEKQQSQQKLQQLKQIKELKNQHEDEPKKYQFSQYYNAILSFKQCLLKQIKFSQQIKNQNQQILKELKQMKKKYQEHQNQEQSTDAKVSLRSTQIKLLQEHIKYLTQKFFQSKVNQESGLQKSFQLTILLQKYEEEKGKMKNQKLYGRKEQHKIKLIVEPTFKQLSRKIDSVQIAIRQRQSLLNQNEELYAQIKELQQEFEKLEEEEKKDHIQ